MNPQELDVQLVTKVKLYKSMTTECAYMMSIVFNDLHFCSPISFN